MVCELYAITYKRWNAFRQIVHPRFREQRNQNWHGVSMGLPFLGSAASKSPNPQCMYVCPAPACLANGTKNTSKLHKSKSS